jgi:Methane oxygenase PmoA
MRSPIYDLVGRRVFLAIAIAGATLPLGDGRDAGGAEMDKPGFRFENRNDKSLGVWEGDRPVLVYNDGPKSLPNVREAGSRSSYVHPIYGLDGEILTDDFPADHYHHHGLFWGWPHVSIDGREYDLWKMRGIRFEFRRWLAQEATAAGAKLGIENGWFVRDRQVMKEVAWFHIQPASAAGRSIDIALTWTPLDDPITLGGAAGKSYGGLTLRFAPRTGTVITTPRGRTAEDLLIAKLPWADLSATFRGADQPSGAALFISPQHPNYPLEWMTREYGVLAAGWPGVEPRTLAAGDSITCRYRLWIHRGMVTPADVHAAYELYRESEAAAQENR